jgi:hypothetical protein
VNDSETISKDVLGYVADTTQSVAPHFCRDCGAETPRDKTELTENDMDEFEQASCAVCGNVFYDNGDTQHVVDTALTAEATAHDITGADSDEHVKTGTVTVETKLTIECTCNRHVTLTNTRETTCDCGKTWERQECCRN